METTLISVGFIFIAIVFWLIHGLIRSFERKAQKNEVKTEGVITGYYRPARRRDASARARASMRELTKNTGSTVYRKTFVRHRKQIYEPKKDTEEAKEPISYGRCSPLTRVTINGKTIEEVANCLHVNPSTHPIGTKVNVIVRKMTLPLVGDMYAINIDEDGFRPISMSTSSWPFKVISLVFLAIGIVMAFVNLIN
ncbi:MAG: hypothetical protein FWG87_06950 [Defluviitaleaceae bacterium]|nr:hypothetical protein [Defluviitaleaceae bacterium]